MISNPVSDCVVSVGGSVAIIIPFRDTTAQQIRTKQLQFLLFYMIPMLQRQKLLFRFYLVNQTPGAPFNRAKLLNIGFLEAVKEGSFISLTATFKIVIGNFKGSFLIPSRKNGDEHAFCMNSTLLKTRTFIIVCAIMSDLR